MHPATPEFEKFLFYRGRDEARLPLQFDARRTGALTLDREGSLGRGSARSSSSASKMDVEPTATALGCDPVNE